MAGGERETRVVGIRTQQIHPHKCACEACGPFYLMGLSHYEATRLLSALERTAGNQPGVTIDDGDWHAQIRYKLRDLLSDG